MGGVQMVFRSWRHEPDYMEWREVEKRWRPPVAARVASAVNLLAGAWLVLAPFVLGFGTTGGVVEGYWNEMVLGLVVATLALVRVSAPKELPSFSVVNGMLGLWLIVSPFVLGYEGPDALAAVAVDVSAGLVIVVMAAVSAASTYRVRARSGRE